MILVFILVISFGLGLRCEESSALTPPPPIAANFGGTKADSLALFEKYLNNGRPEQIAAYRDDNPILKEVLKVFNKTIETQVLGYTAHKAMLVSNDTECDRKAMEKADAIMQKAFDDTTECLISFRQRVRAEVSPSIKNIREVDDKLRASLLLPIDECFDKMKTDTFQKFGQNIAEHIVCSKKIQQN